MRMHPFNREKALRKLRFRQQRGKYIKIGTIILSICIFVGAIIYYSYSKYTVSNKFDVIQTTVGDFRTCSYEINQEFTYNYAIGEQGFSPECNGYYKIELWAASGGSVTYKSYEGTGGNGGYTAGIINLQKNIPIYLYVGSSGTNGHSTRNATLNAGGYNGGGSNQSRDDISPGGGGATDVRVTDGLWNDSASLYSRIMVAGAGGASGINNTGAPGGSLKAVETTLYGYNGTQFAGGVPGIGFTHNSGATSGGFGFAGDGGYYGCGAGGSGYYGGGGGNHITPSTSGGGGSGSSFISGYLGCVAITSSTSLTPRLDSTGVECTATSSATDITCSYHYSNMIFTNGVMKAGNETMPTHDGTSTMTGNSGNGYAKITYLGTTIN